MFGKGKGRKFKFKFNGWLSQENREALLVNVSLTLAFLSLAVLVIALSAVVIDSQQLQLENFVERQFNDISIDLQQNRITESDILADSNILGVGVYNSAGSLIMGWGDVYNMIPVATIARQTSQSDNDTAVSFHQDSRRIEYIRILQQPIPVTSYSLLNASFSGSSLFENLSTIVYIVIDGSAYIARRNLIGFVSLLAFIGVVILYFFVLKINKQNRQYKEQMVKQSNLVNLGQAARTLTHEIKNPLSAITIQLALLKRQIKNPEYLEELALIESESQRLISLTNRVSDFLKNPEGQPEQIDLIDLINQLIPLFAYPVKLLETSEKQAYILFDPDRLRSVIENIIKNGIESCEGRDPQVEVEVVLGRNGIYHVYVRDRGDGIQADAEKLFDPFYTTKIHGSGIGLSISRQFLRARGGDIRISPRPGGGTVVELTIAKYSFVQELVVATAGKKKPGRKKKA